MWIQCGNALLPFNFHTQRAFAGSIPLDPRVSRSEEEGKSFLETFEDSPTRQSVLNVVKQVIKATTEQDELE